MATGATSTDTSGLELPDLEEDPGPAGLTCTNERMYEPSYTIVRIPAHLLFFTDCVAVP